MIKMKNLYSQLVVTLLLVFSVFTLIMVTLLHVSQQYNQALANQQLHQYLAAELTKHIDFWPEQQLDVSAAEQAFKVMMMIGPAIELYIIDAQGQVLAFDAPDEIILRRTIELQPVHQFLRRSFASDSPIALELNEVIMGNDPRSLTANKVFSAAPIWQQEQLQGYLYIIIGGQQYDAVWQSVWRNQRLMQWLIAAGIALVVLMFITLLVFRQITQPLARLRGQLDAYQQSGFSDVLQFEPAISDDIAQLQQSLQSMAQRLASQLQQLQHTHQLRKELLVQISHDLRTPIAAQQAYLETMEWQQAQLSPEQMRTFLQQALQNGELLAQRVNEILALARLENNLEQLNLEPVELNEFAEHCVAKLAMLAQKQQVTLQFQPANQPIWLNMDRQKVERVVINLLENAIAHSRVNNQSAQADTEALVQLQISCDQQQVTISVRDFGAGISEHQLADLFEPYLTNTAAQTDNAYCATHLGLGLAICQRIVQLHHSQIQVQSILGQGAEFSFSLGRLQHLESATKELLRKDL